MTTADQARTLYQGTLQNYDMQPRQLYQGNVDIRNLKSGRLYEGTIKTGAVRAKTYGSLPNRSNPYSYYKLPRHYYGQQRRTRVRPLSSVQPRKKIDKEPIKNKKTEQKKNKVAPAKPKDKQVKPQETQVAPVKHQEKQVKHQEKQVKHQDKQVKPQDKQVAPAKHQNKQVAESPRPPPAINWGEERQKTPARQPLTTAPNRPPQAPIRPPQSPQRPKSRENKRTTRVSPFPPPSPEPAPRYIPKRNPDPLRSQSYHNQNLPQPIFPPILPVTMEDFVNSQPAWRSEPDQRRGNGLIPFMNPPLASSKTGFSKYRRSPDNFFEDKDNYHDSLNRSFNNVPGYNAVGSILRSMDMYY